MEKKKAIWIGIGALALILVTAGASAMITRASMEEPVNEKVTKTETRHHYNRRDNDITWNDSRPAQPAPQQQARACDDGNIVGTVLGAVAGGVAGSQVGSGSGQLAATGAGTLGGAYLGNRYIPTRGVACR